MGKPKTKDAGAIGSLKFLVNKLRPIAERISKLEEELEPLQEEHSRLISRAKDIAIDAWGECVETAVNEWKSSRGDEEPTLEWADSKFQQLPTEICEGLMADADRYTKAKDVYDSFRFLEELNDGLEPEE